MGFSINPDHESHDGKESDEFPICPGCGKRHAPTDVKLAAINVLDLVRDAAKTLGMAPAEDQWRMVASFVGTFAENIPDDVWENIVNRDFEECGEPGCTCHVVLKKTIRVLHLMNVTAKESRKREKEKP